MFLKNTLNAFSCQEQYAMIILHKSHAHLAQSWLPVFLSKLPLLTTPPSPYSYNGTGTIHSHFGGTVGISSSSANRPICPTRL